MRGWRRISHWARRSISVLQSFWILYSRRNEEKGHRLQETWVLPTNLLCGLHQTPQYQPPEYLRVGGEQDVQWGLGGVQKVSGLKRHWTVQGQWILGLLCAPIHSKPIRPPILQASVHRRVGPRPQAKAQAIHPAELGKARPDTARSELQTLRYL